MTLEIVIFTGTADSVVLCGGGVVALWRNAYFDTSRDSYNALPSQWTSQSTTNGATVLSAASTTAPLPATSRTPTAPDPARTAMLSTTSSTKRRTMSIPVAGPPERKRSRPREGNVFSQIIKPKPRLTRCSAPWSGAETLACQQPSVDSQEADMVADTGEEFPARVRGTSLIYEMMAADNRQALVQDLWSVRRMELSEYIDQEWNPETISEGHEPSAQASNS